MIILPIPMIIMTIIWPYYHILPLIVIYLPGSAISLQHHELWPVRTVRTFQWNCWGTPHPSPYEPLTGPMREWQPGCLPKKMASKKGRDLIGSQDFPLKKKGDVNRLILLMHYITLFEDIDGLDSPSNSWQTPLSETNYIILLLTFHQ